MASKTKAVEPEAEVAEDVPRQTGEAQDENFCPVHPDQLLEAVETTDYGSTWFNQCPQCRTADEEAEAQTASGDPGDDRQQGTET